MVLKNLLRAKLQHFVSAKIIIAVSGGPDSVALLNLLKNIDADLTVAHFNHKLRGTESNADEKFVFAMAKKLNLKYEINYADTKKIACEKKLNLEEAARILRYKFFRQLQNGMQDEMKTKKIIIALAHTRDDQIETILGNLIRGAGESSGLGMDEISTDGLWRPLLEVSKCELLKYLKQEKITFQTDRTNQDLNFTRNFLRLKTLPFLKKVIPNVEENILNFAKRSKKTEQKVGWLVENFLGKQSFSNSNLHLLIKEFLQLSPIIRGAVIKKVWIKLHGSINSFEKVRADEIISLAKKNVGGKQVQFGKFLVRVEKSKIIFKKNII